MSWSREEIEEHKELTKYADEQNAKNKKTYYFSIKPIDDSTFMVVCQLEVPLIDYDFFQERYTIGSVIVEVIKERVFHRGYSALDEDLIKPYYFSSREYIYIGDLVVEDSFRNQAVNSNFVGADFRNQGIATQLIHLAIENIPLYLNEKQALDIIVNTNDLSTNIFKKAGFEEMGTNTIMKMKSKYCVEEEDCF